jgi:hypothetical protein
MTNYKVGYGKPPKHTQFKKGVSGNPSGRRKRPDTMAAVLQDALRETITVFQGGKRKTITKMEAAVKRLIDKSIAGDMSAFRVLSVLTQVLSDSPSGSMSELEPLDQKVLDNLFRRVARTE